MTTTQVPTPESTRDAEPDLQPDPAPRPTRPGISTETLAVSGVFIAMLAFLTAVFAVALAARSVDEHRAVVGAGNGAGGSDASTTISLSEFALTPGTATIAAGTGKVSVSNDGAIVHNLRVEDAASPMLNSGEIGELDISALAPGTYSMWCEVPGHEAAGMKGTITVS